MNRRGVTLAECAVALAAGGLVLAALHLLLLAATRARSREAARREVRATLRAAAAILRSELQSVSAPAGDLLVVTDSAVTIRAARGQGTVCAVSAADRVVLDRASYAGLRAADPARDAVRIFLDGDPLVASDDGWWIATVTAVRSAACDDGRAGIGLAFAPPLPASAELGTPVRVLETVEYRLYADATGLRWLGTRTRTSTGWTATSPLAGPLRPGDGLRVAADATGLPAALPEVSLLTISLRARSSRSVPGALGVPAPVEDSLAQSVAVGQ